MDPSQPAVISAPWSTRATTSTDCTFQQLAPYIGRIKTEIARYLIASYSKPGDLILDPFSGSGVIPFEAVLLGRRCVSADISPYAYLITQAKFSAPTTENEAMMDFFSVWDTALFKRSRQDLRSVPTWVRAFFHPETLRSALALRDELVARKNHFLLACLLGILHHQRPGFLSFPSSHLVPYLRDRNFPRRQYPELYEERDVCSRMVAKIERTYRRPPDRLLVTARVLQGDSRTLELSENVDAIITSPPYMNELDYIRDNRLRLWFLERKLPTHQDLRSRNREQLFGNLIQDTFHRLLPRLRSGGRIVLVVGDTRRGRARVDAAALITSIFSSQRYRNLTLLATYRDAIPDVRRSRRDLAGTKNETVLVFQKKKRTSGLSP